MGIRRYPIDAGQLVLNGSRAIPSDRTRGVVLPTLQANADANTFVLNIAGGANANETGAGLGLTGADLVFTQSGSIPGVSNGHRALDGSNDYFTCTAAFVAAWVNQPGWTIAYEFTSFTQAVTKFFCALSASNTTSTLWLSTSRASGTAWARTGLGGIDNCGMASPIPATASKTWLCCWRKNGNIHFGWVTQDTIPTGWDSFPPAQRGVFAKSADFSGTWDTLHIIGSSSGYPALAIGTVVASKIGLSAAPV